MNAIPTDQRWIIFVMLIYVGICFGLIAQKHGKSPLYGLLALISPINLIILGIWAFGKFERPEKKDD